MTVEVWSIEDEQLMCKTLQEGLNKWDLQVSADSISSLAHYSQMLVETNQNVNLTAITDPVSVAEKHFLDSFSLMLLPQIQSMPVDIKIADIGTGGGFPGIPLKVVHPAWSVLLIDSLEKRVRFLNTVIERLALQEIKAIHGRAEELGHKQEYREQFDLVTARAVAKLAVLLELTLPFVKVGGIVVAMKGSELKEEIAESKKALDILGGKLEAVHHLQLPKGGDERNLVVVKKVQRTPKNYPRNPGVPSRRPII